mgnify:CR=1 FL=1
MAIIRNTIVGTEILTPAEVVRRLRNCGTSEELAALLVSKGVISESEFLDVISGWQEFSVRDDAP